LESGRFPERLDECAQALKRLTLRNASGRRGSSTCNGGWERMMAQNDNEQTNARPGRPRAGGWVRIAVIGRNPKITLARIAILVAACVVVFKFILLPIRVEGISMLPAYKDNSVNFVNRLAYVWHEPRRGDVVGIRLSGKNAPYRTPGVMYLKRIVGLPGETVAFANGRLLINGTPLDESYVHGPYDWNADPDMDGSNQYYFVGDNRSMPLEFHTHGKAGMEQIVGKVVF
jgi:signal peptidase I